MVEYREGVESLPIRNKLPIIVIVYSLLENDKVVIERTINYSDYEDRKWLGKISFWAYSNHCSVETMAMTDAEAELVKS
jgi:hypothetical protein